nr:MULTISPECIES: EAL domain-containing protein [unclassified Exiguobacterium]
MVLESTMIDWAIWNDSYDFVQGQNKSFIQNNMSPDTLENLDVSAMVFLNEDRELIHSEFSRFYELESPLERNNFTKEISRFVNVSGIKQNAVYGTDYGPVIFMSHPILKSDRSGPAKGTLIVIQKIGPDFISTVSAQAKVPITISPFSHNKLTIEKNEQFVRVSMPLQSVYQDANWEVNFSIKRTNYLNTISMLQTGMLGLFILGLGLLLTLFWTINRFVTQRLLKIVDELKNIKFERNSRLRIRLNRKNRDEIEEMAVSINNVLDSLDQMRTESLNRAFRDSLTRLPNRLAVEDMFGHMLGKSKVVAVLGIDIDNFRRFNDQFGQRTGDAMLTFLASRLSFYKEDGFAARIGADEFMFIHPHWTIEEMRLVANQLVKDLTEWGRKQGMTGLTASIGMDELSPTENYTYETMMGRLDAVLHEVKLSGKNKILSYQEIEDGSHYLQTLVMERDLRHALKHGEFELHYQPIVSPRPFAVCGVEALIRWNHPSKGPISPGVFIPVAEQLGLISDVGRWVLRQAVQEIQEHTERHNLFLSVNVSKRQIADGSFLEELESVLFESGFEPSLLHIEITETEVGGNIYELQQFIRSLKALGVKISLDDFGVGTSSLSFLQSLQLDIIKIDQNFVKGIPENTFDRALLEGLYQTFHALGLEIVTEGIERPEQLAFVLEHSGSLIQGYHYSKPVPLAQLEHYLKKTAMMYEW